MGTPFRIGVSAALAPAGGSATPFPSYDVGWIEADPRIELARLPLAQPLPAAALAELDAAILLGERLTADSLAAGRRLGLIARMGVGYDTLDVPACTAADVAVTITPPGVCRPMAVAILTFVLALAGRLVEKDRIARGGGPAWETRTQHHGLGLVGRTLAQVGIGNIGAEVFRIARPLGLRFIAHDPYADPALADELGVALLPLDEVFRQADFLSVSCPLSAETRHLVSAERLALMKPTAYLINTARGPVVDQAALVRALRGRRIAGAGLDVFDPEPPAPDDPVLRLDNVLLAPHALGWTDQMFATMSQVNRAAIEAVMAGRAPEHVVNAEVLGRPGFRARLAAWRAGG